MDTTGPAERRANTNVRLQRVMMSVWWFNPNVLRAPLAIQLYES